MSQQTPDEACRNTLSSDEDVEGSAFDLIFLRAVGMHLASSSAHSQHLHSPA